MISFFCVHVTVIFVNVMFKVKVAIVFMMEVHSRQMFDQLNSICDRRAAAVDPFISQVACSCTHRVFVTVIAVCMIRRILITVLLHACLFVCFLLCEVVTVCTIQD